MLGTEVSTRLADPGISVHGTDQECDVTNAHAVSSLAQNLRPDWIVNCSAFTAVDNAEEHEEQAYRINALGVQNISRAADECGATVIHVSTDYVFDGSARIPYQPHDTPNPLSAYGRTKLAGERFLVGESDRHILIRTAWLYGPHGKNFVSTMLRLMSDRDQIQVVDDQHGTPTYAVDLADVIARFIECESTDYGIYHFTNGGATTWHGFATAIRDRALALGLLNHTCDVQPIPTAEYPTPAPRPAYSVLDTRKISEALGMNIPLWQDGLDRFLYQHKNAASGGEQ